MTRDDDPMRDANERRAFADEQGDQREIDATMAAAGFSEWTTGGGCMAWRKECGSRHILITDSDGTGLYASLENADWIVGVFDTETGDEISCRTDVTLYEAIAATEEG